MANIAAKAKAKAKASNETVVMAGGEIVAGASMGDRTVVNPLKEENESRAYLEIWYDANVSSGERCKDSSKKPPIKPLILHKASESMVKIAASSLVKDAAPKEKNRMVTIWWRKNTGEKLTFETSLELRSRVKRALTQTSVMYARILKKEKTRIPAEYESFARHLHLTPYSLYDNIKEDLKKELDHELCQEFLRQSVQQINLGMSMFPKCRDEVVQFMLDRFGIIPEDEWVNLQGETENGEASSSSGSMVYHMDGTDIGVEGRKETKVFVVDPNGEEPVQELPVE